MIRMKYGYGYCDRPRSVEQAAEGVLSTEMVNLKIS